MDGTFPLDLDALRDSVNSSEHLLLRFTPIPERLFLDFRTSGENGPAIALLPQVTSFRERLATIKRVRPDFDQPEKLFVVSWPLRIGSLERLGVLEMARARLADLQAADAIRELDRAYERLLELEREELKRAISGDGYHTIWPPVPQT